MIKEALEFITNRLTDNAKVTPVRLADLESNRRKRVYWNPSTKEIQEREVDRKDVRHKLTSLESVIDYVCNIVTDDRRTNIWIGEERIVVEPFEFEQSDLLTMEHRFSPIWSLLQDLKERSSVPQSRAIRLIRQRFNTFDDGSKALNAVRNMRISAIAESELTPTTSRMGKSISSAAAGASELPDYLTVETPIYSTTGSGRPYPIRVWLSLDFENTGNIIFDPDEGDIDKALALESVEIGAAIKRATSDGARHPVCVYYGEYSA